MVKSKALAVVVILLGSFTASLTQSPTPVAAYTTTCHDDWSIGYSFANGTSDIAGAGEQQAVLAGMNLWEAVSKVDFVPENPFIANDEDTTIGWFTGEHGDGTSFDGPGNVRAHTFIPCAAKWDGDIHFDDAEEWTTGTGHPFEQPADLESIAAHEAGHALGLLHPEGESIDITSVMLTNWPLRRTLAWDDILGVQSLYGRNYSVYHLRDELGGFNPSSSFEYGQLGNIPVTGDWNGDGVDSVGVWSSASGHFTLNDGNPGGTKYDFGYGKAGDRPVVGDWDGDGDTTVGQFRPSNTTFYLENTHSSSSSEWFFSFGEKNDLPVGGDWNGDGIDSVGVFRPSTGTFYLRNEKSAGPPDLTISFGESGDLPVVGDWDNDGDDTIGVYRPSKGLFLLRNSNTSGAADLEKVYGRNLLGEGITPALPVAGDWDGSKSVDYGLYQN